MKYIATFTALIAASQAAAANPTPVPELNAAGAVAAIVGVAAVVALIRERRK